MENSSQHSVVSSIRPLWGNPEGTARKPFDVNELESARTAGTGTPKFLGNPRPTRHFFNVCIILTRDTNRGKKRAPGTS